MIDCRSATYLVCPASAHANLLLHGSAAGNLLCDARTIKQWTHTDPDVQSTKCICCHATLALSVQNVIFCLEQIMKLMTPQYVDACTQNPLHQPFANGYLCRIFYCNDRTVILVKHLWMDFKPARLVWLGACLTRLFQPLQDALPLMLSLQPHRSSCICRTSARCSPS